MIIYSTSAAFTRPADTTAYAANDLVANSTTAGSVVPMQFTFQHLKGFKLWRAAVANTSATNTNGKYTLHLFTTSPTCANGDNGAFSTTSAGWLGSIAVDTTVLTFTDSSIGWGLATTFPLFTPITGPVYGLLQATAAYTPTSAEKFTVTLVGEAYS